MNVERLLAVRQAILDHPEQSTMGWWFSDLGKPLDKMESALHPRRVPDLLSDCGTAGCIAGWTCSLFSSGQPLAAESEMAAALLGLPWIQARKLFHTRHWPAVLHSAYQTAPVDQHATIMAEAIDRFLVEHGVVIPEPPRIHRDNPQLTEAAV